MSSDGRYMYHHQPGTNANYDYAPYPPPPPSYDNSQITQPPQRQMRPISSSHSPPQHYSSAPLSYPPPNYGPGPYIAHPPQQPQWSSDNWANYNQSYPHPHPHSHPPPPPPPPAPPAEVPYNPGPGPGPGRPESVPSSSTEARGYPPQSNPDPRRVEGRQPPLNPPPPQPAGRRREKESPPVASPGTPTGLDFMKLLESYRLIIDANAASSGAGRSPAAETLERMLQSATYGVQMLESAKLQHETPVSEMTRSPKEKELEEAKDSPNGTAASLKRQKTEDGAVQDGQTCLGCNATSTPEWRRGPMGPRTLCNACGLVYAKLIKKRVRERASGKSNGIGAGSQGLGDDSGEEGDSDEDDEYGSQDQRSEAGDEERD